MNVIALELGSIDTEPGERYDRVETPPRKILKSKIEDVATHIVLNIRYQDCIG